MRWNMEHSSKSRKLKIDKTELDSAIENSSSEATYFLDKETGKILLVTDETSRMLEEIYDEEPDEESEEESEEDEFDLENYLKHSDLPDWQKDELRDADRVDNDFGDRYIEIPKIESGTAFEYMEEFTQAVQNQRLKDRLSDVLGMNKPFRRFKDTLADYPEEEKRWFSFEESRRREHIKEWLEDENIELI
jgi:hypothetical protein